MVSLQIPILTDGPHKHATDKNLYKSKLIKYLKEGGIPIIAVFRE